MNDVDDDDENGICTVLPCWERKRRRKQTQKWGVTFSLEMCAIKRFASNGNDSFVVRVRVDIWNVCTKNVRVWGGCMSLIVCGVLLLCCSE